MPSADLPAGSHDGQPSGGRPYLVVSADSHVGPSLRSQLRPYCPRQFLDAFDDYAESTPKIGAGLVPGRVLTAVGRRENDRRMAAEGLQDASARLKDMDAAGVAADVLFAGGGNGEMLPFVGFGVGDGASPFDVVLQAAGSEIFNRWLSDYVSEEPTRLHGVGQITIVDLETAIREVSNFRELGLSAINFPAPRADFPAYSDPIYEPFWSLCEDLDLPLMTHVGGGSILGSQGPGARSIMWSEAAWIGRRALWQLIFGGVFERHPRLRMSFVENRADWVPSTCRDLDSIVLNDEYEPFDGQPGTYRMPSEYWADNCSVVASFMAPYEAALRHEVGVKNLIWGSDYPHLEGTWPYTREHLRFVFADVPEDDVRLLVGENAVRLLNVDPAPLRAIADRIGPTPDEIATPLPKEEIPEFGGHAFRTQGAYA